MSKNWFDRQPFWLRFIEIFFLWFIFVPVLLLMPKIRATLAGFKDHNQKDSD